MVSNDAIRVPTEGRHKGPRASQEHDALACK